MLKCEPCSRATIDGMHPEHATSDMRTWTPTNNASAAPSRLNAEMVAPKRHAAQNTHHRRLCDCAKNSSAFGNVYSETGL